jgi:hypothetical protein
MNRSNKLECDITLAWRDLPETSTLLIGSIHKTRYSSKYMNGPNKLKCYITLLWTGLPETNTLAYWVHSQNSLFFKTYEWAQEATMLHNTCLERLAKT